MSMVKVSFRIEREMYLELKRISEITETPLSVIIRDLVKIGYIVMRPDIRIRVRDLINFLVPYAVEEIEKQEEKLRKARENHGVKTR